MKRILSYILIGSFIFSGFFLIRYPLGFAFYITAVGGLVGALLYLVAERKKEAEQLRRRIANFYNEPTTSRAGSIPQEQAADLKVMSAVIEKLAYAPAPDSVILKSEEQLGHTYTSAEIYKMIKDALKSDRLEVLLQPIVTLPQRKPVAYECFSRIRFDGEASMAAQEYMEVAQSEGLMGAVDNLMLFRAIQMVRKALKRDAHIPFFCNVSEASVADPEFVASLHDFITSNKELLPSLILEVNEGTLYSKRRLVMKGLENLRNTGCQFSLHQLDHLELDVEDLQTLNVRYVKFNGPTFERLSTGRQKNILQIFLKNLQAQKIKLILTHIEDDPTLQSALDHKIGFGQGYLFSPPQQAAV